MNTLLVTIITPQEKEKKNGNFSKTLFTPPQYFPFKFRYFLYYILLHNYILWLEFYEVMYSYICAPYSICGMCSM
jgi:hypothetical protein